MFDKVGAITRQHVDDRNLHHRVATGLQTHRGTCYIHQYLTCEGRVVDAHIELQTLVLSLTADTLTYKVHAMTHITYIVNTLYLEHVCLVAGEIRISLDGSSHLFELSTLFELYIDHTAVDTLAKGNRH